MKKVLLPWDLVVLGLFWKRNTHLIAEVNKTDKIYIFG